MKNLSKTNTSVEFNFKLNGAKQEHDERHMANQWPTNGNPMDNHLHRKNLRKNIEIYSKPILLSNSLANSREQNMNTVSVSWPANRNPSACQWPTKRPTKSIQIYSIHFRSLQLLVGHSLDTRLAISRLRAWPRCGHWLAIGWP